MHPRPLKKTNQSHLTCWRYTGRVEWGSKGRRVLQQRQTIRTRPPPSSNLRLFPIRPCPRPLPPRSRTNQNSALRVPGEGAPRRSPPFGEYRGNSAPPCIGSRTHDRTAPTPFQYRNGKGGREADLNRDQDDEKKGRSRNIPGVPTRGGGDSRLIGLNHLHARSRRTETVPPGDRAEKSQNFLTLAGPKGPEAA